jgi:flagellar protein FliS
MSNQLTASQTYRINQINSASPLDLVLMAYDATLVGCAQCDLGRTTRGLSVLRSALDFSYDAEIATGLFRLYQYCADLARNGEYDQAARLLRELRDAWAQVKARYEAGPSARGLSAAQPVSQPAPVAVSPRLMSASA